MDITTSYSCKETLVEVNTGDIYEIGDVAEYIMF